MPRPMNVEQLIELLREKPPHHYVMLSATHHVTGLSDRTDGDLGLGQVVIIR